MSRLIEHTKCQACKWPDEGWGHICKNNRKRKRWRPGRFVLRRFIIFGFGMLVGAVWRGELW